MKNHPEILIISNSAPVTLIITLPDGCDPGKQEAAEAFAESFKVLKKDYRQYSFQFIPFSYDNFGGLKAILATEI